MFLQPGDILFYGCRPPRAAVLPRCAWLSDEGCPSIFERGKGKSAGKDKACNHGGGVGITTGVLCVARPPPRASCLPPLLVGKMGAFCDSVRRSQAKTNKKGTIRKNAKQPPKRAVRRCNARHTHTHRRRSRESKRRRVGRPPLGAIDWAVLKAREHASLAKLRPWQQTRQVGLDNAGGPQSPQICPRRVEGGRMAGACAALPVG